MTEDYIGTGRQTAAKFTRFLESGEYISWCGTGTSPDSNTSSGSRAHMVFFATFWTAFAVFWTVNVLKLGGVMGMAGVPFILIGIMLYVKAFRAGREKAYFAVTNMRILKIGQVGLEMEYLTNVTGARVNSRGKKADVIYSIEYQGEHNVIGAIGTIGGLDPDEAENVRSVIESESAKAHMYS